MHMMTIISNLINSIVCTQCKIKLPNHSEEYKILKFLKRPHIHKKSTLASQCHSLPCYEDKPFETG